MIWALFGLCEIIFSDRAAGPPAKRPAQIPMEHLAKRDAASTWLGVRPAELGVPPGETAPNPRDASRNVDKTGVCTFFLLPTEWVRTFQGRKLPFFQEIRAKHPHALVKVTLTWGEVVSGKHMSTILSVSHRWMVSNDPECAAAGQPRLLGACRV